MKKKTIILSSVTIGFLILLSLWYFTSLKDVVKKQTATLFKTEFIPSQNMNMETRDVFTHKDTIYQDFRDQFKYHYQTIGLASFPDSSRMILISDPSPFFEIDSIKSIFKDFTHTVETKKHKMGYDGFSTDIIISIANATQENLDSRISKLSKLLYLSDYKPAITHLPLQKGRIYYSKENIDYQISLYEFNQWFIEDDEKFLDNKDTNKTYTVENLFKSKKTGVFFSENPGFVAWSISKKSDLKEQLSYIRQFTLDADLILGALADSAMLVIIGREREAPLEELPPLQVESILLLASVSEKELSQSLDVNDFLAGKMNNGRDWCPTYLSKELENTEFGHLMTITDILLKDWSEKGTIQEYNYQYPEPPYYPFTQPLFKMLGINELVYNWNTADAMYAIDLDQVTIYTLNRTGSLPVSYFNSPESGRSIGRSYENKAYNYFSTVGNTDLARVVQYTALYQLFIDNGITYKGNTFNAFPKNKPYLLLNPVKNLLKIFKSLTDQQIEYIADSVSRRRFDGYHKKKIEEKLKENELNYPVRYTDTQKEQIYKDFLKSDFDNLKKLLKASKQMLNQLSDDQLNKVSRYLAYPRGERVNSQETYQIFLKAKKLRELINAIGKNNLDLLGQDLQSVKNYFVSNLSGNSAKYLKTPSVIITFNDFYTTGGHNLSSKISRVKSMKNYKRTTAYVPESTTDQTDKPTTIQNPKTTKGTKGTGGKGSVKTTKNTGGTPTTPKKTTGKIRSRGEVIPVKARARRGY